MDIFGIGPLEVLFILLIILIVLGPKDLVKAGRTIGHMLRSVVMSDTWRSMQQSIQDVRKLPYQLMREAGMEEDIQALDEISKTARGAWKIEDGPPKRKPSSAELTAWTQPVLHEEATELTADQDEGFSLPTSNAWTKPPEPAAPPPLESDPKPPTKTEDE
jgi:Sec-independent protein translocase protein TatA